MTTKIEAKKFEVLEAMVNARDLVALIRELWTHPNDLHEDPSARSGAHMVAARAEELLNHAIETTVHFLTEREQPR